jgi:transcriptional regulator with XRE-family HTH domain
VPLEPNEQTRLELFGRNLQVLRKEKGLSQEKLAEMADLHPRALQKIEAGDVNVTLTTVLRLQKALNCTWPDLFKKFPLKS